LHRFPYYIVVIVCLLISLVIDIVGLILEAMLSPQDRGAAPMHSALSEHPQPFTGCLAIIEQGYMLTFRFPLLDINFNNPSSAMRPGGIYHIISNHFEAKCHPK